MNRSLFITGGITVIKTVIIDGHGKHIHAGHPRMTGTGHGVTLTAGSDPAHHPFCRRGNIGGKKIEIIRSDNTFGSPLNMISRMIAVGGIKGFIIIQIHKKPLPHCGKIVQAADGPALLPRLIQCRQ